MASREDPLSLHLDDQCLSSGNSLPGTTTSTTTSTTKTIVYACSVEQTRIPGWWVIKFYFEYQKYWTEEGVLDMWGATLPVRLPSGED
jgi:hypothetical protein